MARGFGDGGRAACPATASDQGLVAQAFKYSGTLILTPWKTYNPSNEYDEEFFEFGLFMSRREYKTITRRIAAGPACRRQRGQIRRRPAALWLYNKVKLSQEEGYTLAIREDEAHIVRLIFQWYGEGLGKPAIAAKLNAMGGAHLYGKTVEPGAVRAFAAQSRLYWANPLELPENPKNRQRGAGVQCSRAKTDILVLGRHQAIISPEQWQRVQQRLAQIRRRPAARISRSKTLWPACRIANIAALLCNGGQRQTARLICFVPQQAAPPWAVPLPWRKGRCCRRWRS